MSSLLERSIKACGNNIPDEYTQLKEDIKDKNILEELEKIINKRKLLKRLNELEFIPWYVKQLNINLNNRSNLLIIFQDRLENLYKLCGLPDILIGLWNGIVYARHRCENEEVFGFVKLCIIYWEDWDNIDFWDDDIHNALNVASEYGRLEIVKHFVNRGASDFQEEDNESAWEALKNDHIEVVKYLLEKEVSEDFDNNHALKVISVIGNLKGVKYLIERGANNLSEALNEASRYGHLEIVKYLIERGANNLSEALNEASQYGRLEIVEYLIEQGKVNPPDINKSEVVDINKALFKAFEGKELKVIKYLFKEGKDRFLDINKALFEVLEKESYKSPNIALKKCKTLREKLNYLNTEDISNFLEFNWKFEEIHLIVFQDNLTNLFPLIKPYLPQSLLDLWNKKEVSKERFIKDEVDGMLIDYFAYKGQWEQALDFADYRDDKGLVYAVMYGNLELTKKLFKYLPPDRTFVDTLEELIDTSIEYGHLEIFKWLVKQKGPKYFEIAQQNGHTHITKYLRETNDYFKADRFSIEEN